MMILCMKLRISINISKSTLKIIIKEKLGYGILVAFPKSPSN